VSRILIFPEKAVLGAREMLMGADQVVLRAAEGVLGARTSVTGGRVGLSRARAIGGAGSAGDRVVPAADATPLKDEAEAASASAASATRRGWTL